MKNWIIVGMLVACAAANAVQLTPEQIEQGKINRQKLLEKTGGFMPNKRSGEGCIAIIDAQSRLSGDFLKRRTEKLEDNVWMRCVYHAVDKTLALQALDAALASCTGNVSIAIVDWGGFPALISLPESKCALVNVAALAKDNPSMDKLEHRVSKEMARAFAFALVLNYSGRPGGVMDPITSLKELDMVLVDQIGLDILPFADKSAEKFGIRKFKRTTYKIACEEGWAPPPKNEFQKAIWNAYHEVPSKGLEIKYDPAKGE